MLSDLTCGPHAIWVWNHWLILLPNWKFYPCIQKVWIHFAVPYIRYIPRLLDLSGGNTSLYIINYWLVMTDINESRIRSCFLENVKSSLHFGTVQVWRNLYKDINVFLHCLVIFWLIWSNFMNIHTLLNEFLLIRKVLKGSGAICAASSKLWAWAYVTFVKVMMFIFTKTNLLI